MLNAWKNNNFKASIIGCTCVRVCVHLCIIHCRWICRFLLFVPQQYFDFILFPSGLIFEFHHFSSRRGFLSFPSWSRVINKERERGRALVSYLFMYVFRICMSIWAFFFLWVHTVSFDVFCLSHQTREASDTFERMRYARLRKIRNKRRTMWKTKMVALFSGTSLGSGNQ